MSVDVHQKALGARERTRANGRLQRPLHLLFGEDDPFPYLEAIVTAARKHPYAMLGAMISVASLIVIAVTTLSLAMIGTVFSLYGDMREMKAQQVTIIQKLDTYETDIKVLRTYESSVLSRQNFMAGLMSPEQQARLAEWDRSNPVYVPPPKQERRKDSQN